MVSKVKASKSDISTKNTEYGYENFSNSPQLNWGELKIAETSVAIAIMFDNILEGVFWKVLRIPVCTSKPCAWY